MEKTEGGLVAEASMLGLRPGQWPDELKVEGVAYERRVWYRDGDDVLSVTYVAGDGRILEVLND